MNDIQITGNSLTTSGSNTSYWDGMYWHYTYPVEPATCIGKAHVFECEHVKKCKCGAIERVMGKQKRG